MFLNASVSSYGMKFSLVNNIIINRLGIAIGAWVNTTTTSINFKIYAEGNSTPLHSYVLFRKHIYNGYYTLPLETHIILTSGTYRYSVGLDLSLNYYLPGSIMVFPSQLSNVQAAYINNQPDGAYPSSLMTNVQASSGFFWFYDSTYKIYY